MTWDEYVKENNITQNKKKEKNQKMSWDEYVEKNNITQKITAKTSDINKINSEEILPRAREERQANKNTTATKIKNKINSIGSKTKDILTSQKTLELFKNVDDAYYRQRRNDKQKEIERYENILNNNENLDQNTRQSISQTIENLKSETFADEDKRREKEANFQKAIDNVSQKGQGNLQDYMNAGNVEIVQDTSGYFKGSRAFDDGYQFGDVTKTVLGTVGDAGLSLGKGIMSIGEVGGDILTHGIANVADLLGNEEYAKQLRYNADNMNVIDNIYRPVQKKVDKNSVFGDKMDNTVQSVGNNVGTMALQAAGVPWQVTTGATTMREGLLEAKAEGATGAEAWIYAGIKTGSEIGSEYLFGGVPLKGTGETADQLIDGLTSKITSKTAKKLAQFGINSLGEGAEEILSGLGGALGKKLTYMKEAELSKLYSSEEMLDSFISGTISSMLLGGGREAYNHFNTNSVLALPESRINEQQKTIKNVETEMLPTANNENSFTRQNEIIDNKDTRLKELGNIDVANNQETLYNSVNESEVSENEQGQGRREYTNGIQESSLEGERKNAFSADRYKQEEKAIRQQGEVKYNDDDRRFSDKLKNKYNKKVFIYDDTNTSYGGGLSYIDNDTIMFGRNALNNYGYDFLEGHEILEDINKNYKDTSENTINNLKEKLQQDEGFGDVFLKYLADMDDNVYQYYIDKPELIAKEIIGDLNGLRNANIDYKTLENYSSLKPELVQEIQREILKLENTIYNKKTNILTNDITALEESIEKEKEAEKSASFNLLQNEEGKRRKHYKSISESEQVTKETRQEARKLYENERYTPISNVETISKANENISRVGVDDTYTAFRTKIKNNEKVSLQDIATGERLIQIYSEKGDTAKVNDLMQDVAILGTELGQQVQALSIIKKASPEGQLLYVNKVVDRTNTKLNTDIKVTEEMANKILKSKSQQELENAMTEIAVELGEQLPLSTSDKIRSWRYLSMLGNPKTHIKNLGANVAMNLTQQVKNKVGGAVEDVAGVFNKDLERTKTLKFANKDQRQFAKQDAEYMKDKIDGGGKYDIKNMIQNNKKQFNNKALNSVAEFNSNMLEVEDNIFLKKAYRQALQNYMSANKLSSADMKNNSILQKAREYASYQAQEATFHQFNALAQRLTEIENKGGIAGKAVEAVLPFKKTPMNIAKAGVEYSPVGLAKSLTTDLINLKNKTMDYKAKLDNGTITKAQYKAGTSKLVTNTIDNFAKGLTGTSLSVLGYFLADAGILKAGNDGDDDEFKEKTGEQEYSIKIGDYTYTLDWVAPSAIPVFIGGTVHDLIHSEKEDNSNILNSLMTATAKTFEPMTEMSMLQGLTSAISSYEQGSSTKLFDLGASAVSSYAGQFVPTLLGQVAKTIDPIERDTSSTAKGLQKKLDQFIKQQTAKVPFLSKTLPARKNMWGEDKVRNSNVLVRAYEVAISPYNRKKIVEDATEAELLEVFNTTGDNVLPGNPNKDLTINTKKYRMTSEEYNEAKGKFGKTAKSGLDNLINSSEYKKLTDKQKVRAIDNVYSYAKEQIKVDYSKKYELDYNEDALYKTANEVKKSGGNASDYFSYKATTDGMKDKEKIETLTNANYSKETKKSIYENTVGKDDKKYEIVKGTNINITEYLKYKNQEFASDKKDDGTVKGKSVSGSKKTKVWNYIDNMNVTYTQKVLLYGMEYTPNKTQKELIVNYINSLQGKTNQEKLDMLSNFKGFTINKDGTFEY